MARPLLPLALFALCLPAPAFAHGGQATVAWVNDPIGVGNVVDGTYTFTWADFDRPIATGTATVDFYFIKDRPPTFSPGRIPEPLDGTAIVTGVLEKDTTNSYTWDLSGVASGSYLIWSRVNEPPSEIISPLIIAYSPGVLTVHHANDPVYPAVIVTSPDTPFRYADNTFKITYSAFDPDATGVVKLEAGTSLDGSNFLTLAENLPASPNGSFDWDTSNLAEGDWTLRASMVDGRGYSFTHYSRYFLLVTHLGPRPDAGDVDGGGADGSEIPQYDGGDMIGPRPEPKGCGCTAGGGSTRAPAGWAWLVALACTVTFWRTRTRTDR